MPPTRQLKFRETLAELIEARGFHEQQQLAERLQVTGSSVSQYLGGRSLPAIPRLIALADILGVSLDFLICGAEYGQSEDAARTAAGAATPSAQWFNHALLHFQEKSDAQTRILGRLTDVLSVQLKTVAEKIASSGVWEGGIVTEDETQVLESYSVESSIILMNLDYDIVKKDGQAEPSLFFDVVANNLDQGRKYRFLLPSHVDEWKPMVHDYRDLLQQRSPNRDILRHCQFRRTKARILGGCGLYELDVDALRKDEPVKYIRFQDSIVKGRLGYVIAASRSLQADSLMDGFHLSHALKSFELLWKDAQAIP
jgi:transcriptional regulator with XRE-family HTH domain